VTLGPIAMTPDSAGLYGLEDVLRVARRDHDQSKHRAVAGVPRGMGHSSRDEHEAAGGDSNLAVAEQERGLTARDVKRLVRGGWTWKGGAGWSAGIVPARTR
jgi:hypothetical protein